MSSHLRLAGLLGHDKDNRVFAWLGEKGAGNQEEVEDLRLRGIGIIIAILGAVLTITFSLGYDLSPCPTGATCSGQSLFLGVNSLTYLGVIVLLGGIALFGIDLMRGKSHVQRS